MRQTNIVDSPEFAGLNMSLHPAGPKFTVRCGACPATFRARVPRVDGPTVQCPSCRSWNRLCLVWETEA